MRATLLLLVAATIAAACAAEPPPHHRLEGSPAPGFALTEVTPRQLWTSDSPPPMPAHTLAQERGRVVVLTFWGTWCGECVEEQEALSAVAASYRGQPVILLGIAVDEWRERVAAYAARHDVAYPLLLDESGRVRRAYSVIGVPETFVIDSNGILRAWLPSGVTAGGLKRAINRVLRVPSAEPAQAGRGRTPAVVSRAYAATLAEAP